MPVNQQDFIQLPITKADILLAIKKTRNRNFHDNLRDRTSIIKLDSAIRGFIGERSLRNWFTSHDIHFEQVNTMNAKKKMDIDFVYKKENRTIHLEVKTSLVADVDKGWNDILKKRDIKLIRRGDSKIEALQGDLHLQVYFYGYRKKRDTFLRTLDVKLDTPAEELCKLMQLEKYFENTYFIAWIDKPTLINQINTKTRKIWAFGKREFWFCNLGTDAKAPLAIIDYLKDL